MEIQEWGKSQRQQVDKFELEAERGPMEVSKRGSEQRTKKKVLVAGIWTGCRDAIWESGEFATSRGEIAGVWARVIRQKDREYGRFWRCCTERSDCVW